MRISVDHRATYRFSDPQARIVQLLRLRPSDTGGQTVVDWRIDVDCDARLRPALDGFGNEVTMLYADGPIDRLELTVSGEVLTMDTSGVLHGAREPLPPMLFLRTTPRTTPGGELRFFAHEAMAGAADALGALHCLNTALFERFDAVPLGRDRGFSAGAAFALEALCPRERAHVFLAAARGAGLPARYVAGYRQQDGGDASMPHAWAEAHVDGLGWVAFDPSAGICADEHYVRVAVGLDSPGAAMVTGLRTGAGEEELALDVHVERVE